MSSSELYSERRKVEESLRDIQHTHGLMEIGGSLDGREVVRRADKEARAIVALWEYCQALEKQIQRLREG